MEKTFWKFEHTEVGHATRLFGIGYQSPDGQHILCSGMYEWQCDWLLAVLECVEYTNMPPYPTPVRDI